MSTRRSTDPELLPRTIAAYSAQRAIRRIAFVALAAIVLGLAMQTLLLLARFLAGGVLPGAGFVAELAGTVTWSSLVCTGVAVGVSLGRARSALAGLFGLVFGPVGLAAAKAAQKLVAAMVQASTSPALLSIEAVGAIRAVEYGLLAFTLAVLSERKILRLGPYLTAGVATGALFGGTVVVLTILADSLSGSGRNFAGLASTILSEVGFPIGCAALIYMGQLVTHNHSAVQRNGPSGALPA